MITDVQPLTQPWEPDAEYALDLVNIGRSHPALGAFADRLGDTPLDEAPGPRRGAHVLAKHEGGNPCGSVKDRVALALLAQAMGDHRGRGTPRIVEYSGGNLASPLAHLCSKLGVDLTLVLSDATSPAYVRDLRATGMTVELVDRHRGFVGVITRAQEIASDPDEPRQLLYQHRSRANPWIHRVSTGRELLDQLGATVPDRFVASVGTGGTLVGVLSALRVRYPNVLGVVVSPSELPYGSSAPPNGQPKYAGSGGLGNGIKQPFVRVAEDQIVGHRNISRIESLAAMSTYRALTGVRIGSSAAANWLAAWEVAASLGPDRTVITIFPDAGSPSEWEEIDR